MIFQPGLRRFVIVPLAANVILFSLMGWALYEMVADFYDAAMLSVPEWLQFLSWIITPLLWIIGGLVSGYASTLAVLMLTSPFHSLLAEKVEERLHSKYPTARPAKTIATQQISETAPAIRARPGTVPSSHVATVL